MPERPRVLAWTLLLALFSGSLFFCRLDCPLLEPEEGRYAEIPRQMLAQGRFFLPVLHGQPYYQKPPLLYWLVMASFALLGPHDWAARLVPACAGLLTVLITYRWGRHSLGHRGALAGALVLCLLPRFVYLERMLGMDTLLCLAVAAALLAAAAAVRTAPLHRGWWVLSAGAAGLGILVKGPVALALVLPPVVLAGYLDRRLGRPSLRGWLLYLAIATVVAGPWYLLVLLADPAAAAEFFWLHNITRYVRPFDHAKPWWFFMPGVLLGLLPWVALVPAAWLVRRRRGQGQPPGLRFFLVAGLWGLLFFSLSGCKRAIYILPLLPPLALALGSYLAATVPAWPRRRVIVGASLCLPALLGLTLAWIWFWLPRHHDTWSLRRQVIAGMADVERGVPVACYPHRWDSVSFYLGRDDVQAYERGGLGELVTDLAARPRTLLLVGGEGRLREVVRRLPAGLSLEPCGESGLATAVRVRRAQGGS